MLRLHYQEPSDPKYVCLFPTFEQEFWFPLRLCYRSYNRLQDKAVLQGDFENRIKIER
jgi:hypothetical protein